MKAAWTSAWVRPKILRPCRRPAASSTPLPGLPLSQRGISPFAVRLLTGLNHYLNATSSLTSPKANTQTETMLPRSQPPKASLDLPSSPAKRRGVAGPIAVTGNRPLPGPLSRRGISAPRPIRSLFVRTNKRIRPEPGPRKNLRRTPSARTTRVELTVVLE